MPLQITMSMLDRVFSQFGSQAGRAQVVELLNEIEVRDSPSLGSQIAQTLLDRLQRDGQCSPSDKQLYRLAQVVEQAGIDLTQYLVVPEQTTIQAAPNNSFLRGLIISRKDEGVEILLSDKSVRFFPHTDLDTGIFVVIRGINPTICPFESGKDDTWLASVWPTLVKEFESDHVSLDAFILAGKKVRKGLVRDFYISSHRSDKDYLCEQMGYSINSSVFENNESGV